ncbi:MAG TPA: hypothetical protein VHC47_08555, partial [Mucilaginibacter sp.]|nr:hypothetical protein [Mucilaginibacter sp.]
VEWALKAIRFAFGSGVQTCSVIATRSGNGVMEVLQQQGHYAPPSLDALEKVFERALGLKKGRVFVDTWEIGFLSHCPVCFDARKHRLECMNLGQHVLPQISCNCQSAHA